MTTTETKLTPPYIPLATIKGLVHTLSETTTPLKIDRAVLSSMSGGAQTQVISGLKFLQLIDASANTLPALRALVQAYLDGPDKWKATLAPLLVTAYTPIVRDFNLEQGNYSVLAKLFSDAGVPNGQMLEKTVRFYWTAMQDAGFKVSHYIAKAKFKSQASGRKKDETKKDAAEPNGGIADAGAGRQSKHGENPPPPPPPENYIDQPVLLPGRSVPALIRFPRDITAEEFAFLAHAVEGVKLYAAARKGGAG